MACCCAPEALNIVRCESDVESGQTCMRWFLGIQDDRNSYFRPPERGPIDALFLVWRRAPEMIHPPVELGILEFFVRTEKKT